MQPSDPPRDGLLRSTLVGEYACVALLLHAAIGSLVWVARSVSNPAGLAVVAAGCWIIGRCTGAFTQRVLAPFVTVGLIFTLLTLSNYGVVPPTPLWAPISSTAFVVMLLIVFVVDLLELAASSRGRAFVGRLRRWNWFRIAAWSGGVALAAYLVLVPAVALLIDQFRPIDTSRYTEDMSLAEHVRLRTTEALTAVAFFAFGAAVGSFLNVVAYRAPRGASIAFQRSRCPSCGSQISGRDNLPIFGWMMLNGRCRTCAAPISPRYPAVEALTASLFLLLYFVELISGGENIPVRRPNLHNGVVWIIFYTKWDMVGLYLFHCFAIVALLTWALIDIEGRRIPAWLRWGVAAVLGVLPAISMDLLPVPWWGEVGSPYTRPVWTASRALGTVFLGGLVGALLGWLASTVTPGPRRHTELAAVSRVAGPLGGHVLTAGLLVGLSLGWQAAVGVWLLTLALRPIAVWAARQAGFGDPPTTTVALVAYVAQLVGWRGMSVSWWPSANTSLTAWAVISVTMVVLWGINRAISRQSISPGGPRRLVGPPEAVADVAEI